MRKRHPRSWRLVLASVLALGLAACGGSDGGGDADPTSGSGSASGTEAGTEPPGDVEDGPTVTVGSFNFAESTILAEIYAQALEDAGIPVERQLDIGARELIYPDLESGAIDLLPEYLGSALAVRFEGEASADVDATYDALLGELESVGLTAYEPSEAEDKNVFVVTPEFSEEHGVTAVGDLADAGDLVMGGPPECEERPTCYAGLVEAYGLDTLAFETIQETPIRVESLANGEIDVALMFSTDPPIQERGLVVLEEPEGIVAAENVVPVVSQEVADAYGDTLAGILDEISAALTTEDLQEMNGKAFGGEDPADIAAQWLQDAGLVG